MIVSIFEQFPCGETERCLLIQPRSEFAAQLFEIYGDNDTMQFMQRPPAQTVLECETLIAAWNDDFQCQKSIRWAIMLKNNPEKLIGTVALHYWSIQNRRVELGADINKLYWGKGISSEVTKEVIDFAFEKLNVNRLELRCDPRNMGSIVIAQKFGFTFEGTLREHVYVEGKGFVDETVYAKLRKDHLALKKCDRERM